MQLSLLLDPIPSPIAQCRLDPVKKHFRSAIPRSEIDQVSLVFCCAKAAGCWLLESLPAEPQSHLLVVTPIHALHTHKVSTQILCTRTRNAKDNKAYLYHRPRRVDFLCTERKCGCEICKTYQSQNDLTLIQLSTILLPEPLGFRPVQTLFDINCVSARHEQCLPIGRLISGDLDNVLGHVAGCIHGHVVLGPLGTNARKELGVRCPRACIHSVWLASPRCCELHVALCCVTQG